ncbi:hypothetical protein Tco_1348581, partial [Tanacetum coccineum]
MSPSLSPFSGEFHRHRRSGQPPPENFSGEFFGRVLKLSPSPDLSDPPNHAPPRALSITTTHSPPLPPPPRCPHVTTSPSPTPPRPRQHQSTKGALVLLYYKKRVHLAATTHKA